MLIGFAYWVISLLTTASATIRTIGLLIILYIGTLLLLVNVIKQFLKKKKAPAEVNQTITFLSLFALSFALMGVIVFGTRRAVQNEIFQYQGSGLAQYLDELPLTVEDLMDAKHTDDYIIERRSEESPLLGQFHMSQYPWSDAEHRLEMYGLNYTITQVKAPFLYNLCKNALRTSKKDKVVDGQVIFGNHYESVDAKAWGAEEAYRSLQNGNFLYEYLLCYEDCLVEITFSWEPTSKQMGIVSETLSFI